MAYPVVHFEIPADDVMRARDFYKKAFGWKISDPMKMDYFFVHTRKPGEEGIDGGLMLRKMPGQPFMNYVAVRSIDSALAKVERAGGIVNMEKTEIAQNMGWIAVFMDTESNLMGLYQAPKVKPAKNASPKGAKKAAKK